VAGVVPSRARARGGAVVSRPPSESTATERTATPEHDSSVSPSHQIDRRDQGGRSRAFAIVNGRGTGANFTFAFSDAIG